VKKNQKRTFESTQAAVDMYNRGKRPDKGGAVGETKSQIKADLGSRTGSNLRDNAILSRTTYKAFHLRIEEQRARHHAQDIRKKSKEKEAGSTIFFSGDA